MSERVMSQKRFDGPQVILGLTPFDLTLWLVGAIGALFVSVVFVFRKWDSYSLPIRLLPLDILTLVLLIDLNIKSLSNITVDNLVMKVEALAFTGLLAFVLFAPVLWRVVQNKQKPKPT